MASGKEYLHFILEQLSDLDDISYRPMMGEFILYYRGKIVGGIYDDRLLVKKTRSALELMPAAICELPYEGAKEMLLVDEEYETNRLRHLFSAFECVAELNADLLKSTVSEVLVTRQNVKLRLKNGQVIERSDLQ